MLHISNVQHFSTGDGEGIRTTVFFQGCNLHCPWCHNPENLHVGVVTLRYHSPDRVEQMGRSVTAEQLLPELLEDADFYKPDGGVTFSGGEVLLQAAEAAELARLLHQNGISVLVDTAGCLRYDAFAALNPYVSGYLFDFKTADAARCRAIGGDLSLIKQNLARLLREGIGVRIRIPLIPDFNVDAESVENICTALREIGVTQVDLLPFHRLASAKYQALDIPYPYRDTPPLSAQQLDAIQKQYARYFNTKIER